MICAVRAPAVLAILLLTLASAFAQERTPGSVPRPLSPRNANYVIDVRLDPPARTLTGRETLVWINTSSAPATELQFHLYYNAWRNNQSTYMRETQQAGGRTSRRQLDAEEIGAIDVSSVKMTGGSLQPADLTSSMRFLARDDGNEDDRTVMAVTLPSAIQPNQSVSLEIAWTSKIPRAVDRTGVTGRQFFLAQWFPKIGVLQNNGTWSCHQFHVATEFFSDYGVYDVRMTVPRG